MNTYRLLVVLVAVLVVIGLIWIGEVMIRLLAHWICTGVIA